jgi:hypothetical protein
VAIPADEPVFLIRARDAHAVDALERYLGCVFDCSKFHKNGVIDSIVAFKKWQVDNPGLVRRPD